MADLDLLIRGVPGNGGQSCYLHLLACGEESWHRGHHSPSAVSSISISKAVLGAFRNNAAASALQAGQRVLRAAETGALRV